MTPIPKKPFLRETLEVVLSAALAVPEGENDKTNDEKVTSAQAE